MTRVIFKQLLQSRGNQFWPDTVPSWRASMKNCDHSDGRKVHGSRLSLAGGVGLCEYVQHVSMLDMMCYRYQGK